MSKELEALISGLKSTLDQLTSAKEKADEEAKLRSIVEEIVDAKTKNVSGLSSEDRELLNVVREAVKIFQSEEEEDEEPEENPEENLDEEKEKKKRKTVKIPGRKPGSVYDYDIVKDEKGRVKVKKLPWAEVYSGEEEPDEIELEIDEEEEEEE